MRLVPERLQNLQGGFFYRFGGFVDAFPPWIDFHIQGMGNLIEIAPRFVQLRNSLGGKLPVYRRAALRPWAGIAKSTRPNVRAGGQAGGDEGVHFFGQDARRGVKPAERLDFLGLIAGFLGQFPGGTNERILGNSAGIPFQGARRQFQQGKLSLNLTRDYYVLQKNQPKPTDPITYDLVPLNGPVHVGDIVAVRLALGGTSWKYLLAEDPIPAGTEFLPESGLYTINHKPDWWADFFTRKEFHDDRAAFFNTDFSVRREYVYLLKVDNPGKFQISPADAGPMYQPNIETTTDPATLEVQP